jgi:hypothetical protein
MPSAMSSPLFRRPRHALASALIIALLLSLVPVLPVAAEELAPETVSVVVDGLETEPGSAAASPGSGGATRPGDGTVLHRSDPIRVEIPFATLGFRAPSDATIRFRTADLDGNWTSWQAVEPLDDEDGPDPRSAEADRSARHQGPARWVSDAIWVGESLDLQLEVAGADLDDIEVHAIDPLGLSEGRWARLTRQLRAVASPPAAEAYPGIVTRRQWGANESWRSGRPSYASVKFGVLHHTAGSNSYTRAEAPGVVRGIYHWHTSGNGWSDIGYNFLVDRYGTVYEGRYGGIERGVVGAHAAGWNSGSFGVAIMGNFQVASPPAAAVAAANDVIAWKYLIHGIPGNSGATVSHNGRTIPRLVGHRDVGQTSCPGQYLASRMPQMRRDIAAKVAAAPPPEPEVVATYASLGWIPVTGDWNGNGRQTPGRFRAGRWELSTWQSTAFDIRFSYGREGDVPVVGDWNGDGRDTIGIVRGDTWHLRDSLSGGTSDRSTTHGDTRLGDVPVTGDFNGDGRDTIGYIRDGEWRLLRDALPTTRRPNPLEVRFTYGRITRGDLPLVGDWNRDGRDTVGIVRDGTWHLRDSLSSGTSDRSFVYGRVSRGDLPVVADWNGDGRPGVGIVRGTDWLMKNELSSGNADTISRG